MNSNIKIVLALATGTAAGIITGLLCASETGKKQHKDEVEKKCTDLLEAALKKANTLPGCNKSELKKNVV